MKKLLISPHCDDESLFASFTIMAEKPQVLVVYDSYVQPTRGYTYATAGVRRSETIAALKEMGLEKPPIFLGLRDDETDPVKLAEALGPHVVSAEKLWAPAPEEEGGNRHHELVGRFVQNKLGRRNVEYYLTYSSKGKSTSSRAFYPTPDMVIRKHRALARYVSQIEVPDCRPHFLRSQEEYYLT